MIIFLAQITSFLLESTYLAKIVMQQLILYTKQNCHLCDQAEQILQAVQRDIPIEVEQVDIAAPQNMAALARYGERIPVLSQPGRETELNWPFSLVEVKAYLAR